MNCCQLLHIKSSIVEHSWKTLPKAQRTRGLSSYHKFKNKSWSRFWRWNLIKICVLTCDMNSTLGSVVPLAMFLRNFTLFIFYFLFSNLRSQVATLQPLLLWVNCRSWDQDQDRMLFSLKSLEDQKHCQRHNGPEGWVHTTRSHFTVHKFWAYYNFRISIKH